MNLTPKQAYALLMNPNVDKKVVATALFENLVRVVIKNPGLSASKVLGLSIVGVSTFIKIPQIRKIVEPSQLEGRISVAKGLTIEGISLETLGYLINVVYNKQNNNPFSNYGESFFLGLQNAALILLIKYYKARQLNDEGESLKLLIKPAVIMLAIAHILAKILPVEVISGLQLLTIPLSIVSKLPQIARNRLLQSTAHLSQVTVGANLLGALIRVFTTVQDFDKLGRDKVLLTGSITSLLLNGVLAGQCYFYGHGKED